MFGSSPLTTLWDNKASGVADHRGQLEVADGAAVVDPGVERLEHGPAEAPGEPPVEGELEVIAAARRVTGAKIPYDVLPRREGDPPALVAGGDKAKRFLGCRVVRTPLAYPVFLTEYEADRRRFEQGTGVQGLYSVGRNGEFAHILMEDVFWRTRRKLVGLVDENMAPHAEMAS